MAERETLLLIDGHNLVFRAFYAMPALTNSRGEMNNAVYGFTSMLLKALDEHHPDYAIAAFDPPGPTFRHEEFAAYKAQRKPMPDELRPQLPQCREMVEAFGIPSVEQQRYEADDVVGTLARRGEQAGLDVLILTGDLDALQLVTDHVRVFAARRGITDTIVYDLERVRERYGFEPPQVVDFKALQGDVSDNIPGVPGIGEKTAKQLIWDHGPLEQVLAAVPTMKEGKVKRVLTEFREQAELSKRMATIECDLDVPMDLDRARLRDYDRDRVRALLARHEMPSLIARLPVFGGQTRSAAVSADGLGAPPEPIDTRVIRDLDDAEDAVAILREAPGVSLRAVVEEPVSRGRVVGFALAPLDDSGVAYYLPVGHGAAAQLPGLEDEAGSASNAAVAAVGALIADPLVAKSGYDLKREMLAWRRQGVTLAGLGFDLLLAAYLVNTAGRVPTLTALAHDHLGIAHDPEDTILGTGRSRRKLHEVPVEEAANHLGSVVALVAPLVPKLRAELERSELMPLYSELELPLVGILAEMERHGIAIDAALLRALSADLTTRIAELQLLIDGLAGAAINVGSPQQLQTFLYDQLNLASGRKTKTGRSTDADALESLRGEHPVVGHILEWRQLTKLKGTYVDALPNLCAEDGRVHTSFNQAVATTGRLSSSDPNLQNIPIRTPVGQRIRQAFVVESGDHLLVSADYSQIELRVLAHVSGEEQLIRSFRRGEDIHRRTAAEVSGVAAEAVTPEMRRNAKVVNFGVVYGLSDFGLARDTGMAQADARVYIDRYFSEFAAVSRWLERTRNQAREWGWVETLFHRRRYIPDIRSTNWSLRGGAERMAVNMPIQGTAADIMKQAMILVDEALRELRLRTRLLLQVHDELVLEVPRDEVDDLVALLTDRMGAAAELCVPLVVDVKVGENWNAMTPVAVGAAVSG